MKRRLKTSRDRPKSAPFLRLKNSKKASRCQSILSNSTRKTIFLKTLKMPKKIEGAFWSRPVLYVSRETFLVQFLGPTGTIWPLLKFFRTFGRTFSVISGVSKKIKTLTKSHDFSRLFLRKAPTNNNSRKKRSLASSSSWNTNQLLTEPIHLEGELLGLQVTCKKKRCLARFCFDVLQLLH